MANDTAIKIAHYYFNQLEDSNKKKIMPAYQLILPLASSTNINKYGF